MADITGSINGTQSSNHTFGIEWEIISQSIPDNTSNVRARSFIKRNSGTGSYSGIAEPGSVTINGQVFNFTSTYDTRNSTAKQYLTGWRTVNNILHNPDGTKSITISATYNANNSPYMTTMSASASVALTPINRVSVLGSIAPFAIEDIVTLPITKYISSYTDDLTISFGSTVIASYTNVNNGDTIQFNPSQLSQLYSLTQNTQSVNGIATFNLTFQISTYNEDSTLVGSNNFTVLGLIVDANPVLNSFTYQDINSLTLALTGNNQQAIQGQSQIQVSGNYTLQKGATFQSYQITLNNQIVDSDTIIPNNTSANMLVQVRDSRGNLSDPLSVAITIYEYSIPSISDLELYKPDPTSNQIYLKVSGSYSNILTNNLVPISYVYRQINDTSWSNAYNINLPQNNGVISIDNLLLSLDNTLNWEFQITIGDMLFTLPVFDAFVFKSSPDFEIINGGVNVNGDIGYLLNGEPFSNGGGSDIYDYGSNANGDWIRYNNGWMICKSIRAASTVSATQVGSIFYGSSPALNYPQPFISPPQVANASIQNGGAFWFGMTNNGSMTATSCGFRLFAAQTFSNTTVFWGFIAIGKWK